MLFGNHQHMSWIDGVNRQKVADHLALIDDTRWSFPCDDVAEDAGLHGFHLFLLLTLGHQVRILCSATDVLSYPVEPAFACVSLASEVLVSLLCSATVCASRLRAIT